MEQDEMLDEVGDDADDDMDDDISSLELQSTTDEYEEMTEMQLLVLERLPRLPEYVDNARISNIQHPHN